MIIIYLNCNISDFLVEKENNIFILEFVGYDVCCFELLRLFRMLFIF